MREKRYSLKGRKSVMILLSAVLLLTLILSACKAQDEDETQDAAEKRFGIDFKQEFSIAGPQRVICGQNSVWVRIAEANAPIYCFDYEQGTSEAEEIVWRQKEGEYLLDIAECDGTLYAQVLQKEENISEIRRLDGDGQWSPVTEAEAEENYSEYGGFLVDSRGCVYLAAGSSVTRLDEAGKKGCEYKLEGNVCCLEENGEGIVQCVTAGTDTVTLYELRENTPEKKWTLKAEQAGLNGWLCRLQSDEETLLCLVTRTEILFVDCATGSLSARTNLTVMGVPSVLAGRYDSGEETLTLYGGGENDGNLFVSLASALSGDEEPRTELVYGTLGSHNDAAVAAFNQTNENYYITIKKYPENYEQQISMEMAAGKAPDIIDLAWNYEYYESYVRNRYLEDLRPYLEQSEYREDILWNVLDTYDSGGGLYLLAPHFIVEGLLINPQYKVEKEDWNMGAFLQLVEENQWEKDIYEGHSGRPIGDPLILLQFMLAGRQEEFIHREQRTVSFESEAFVELLELCREYGEQDWAAVQDRTEQDVLCEDWIGAAYFEFYLSDTEWQGREYQIYGFPTSSGQVYEISVCPDCCGIYAGSANKEGAWEFLESLLAEDWQRKRTGANPGFPVRKSILKEFEEAGSGVRVGKEVLTLTEKELLIMEDVIYNGEFVRGRLDETIWNIVEEETAPYFAGDKSAEEVVKIIQSRVGLMLQE